MNFPHRAHEPLQMLEKPSWHRKRQSVHKETWHEQDNQQYWACMHHALVHALDSALETITEGTPGGETRANMLEMPHLASCSSSLRHLCHLGKAQVAPTAAVSRISQFAHQGFKWYVANEGSSPLLEFPKSHDVASSLVEELGFLFLFGLPGQDADGRNKAALKPLNDRYIDGCNT